MVVGRQHRSPRGSVPRVTDVRDRLRKTARRSCRELQLKWPCDSLTASEESSGISNSLSGGLEKKISLTQEECSGLIDEYDGNSSSSRVVLQGTIPDVLQWTRGVMDEEKFCPGPLNGEENDKEGMSDKKNCSARDFARRLNANYCFRLVSESTYWKTEVRLWENVCAFAAKLPNEREARTVFDSMRRYPSSALVHWGLKIMFGRYMAIRDQRFRRLPLRQNAIALFCPSSCNRRSVKEWFEHDTHVRLQEKVIHMCALSEYILRCAFIAKQRNSPSCFPSLLEERIEAVRDYEKLLVVQFVPWNILMELFEKDAAVCLQAALLVANTGVIEGSKAACKNCGRKRTGGKQREKIKMSMLRRPLTEVMDRVIKGLENVILNEVKVAVDVDYYRLHATRAMRKIMAAYVDVANVEEELHDVVAKNSLPDNPYMYSESS